MPSNGQKPYNKILLFSLNGSKMPLWNCRRVPGWVPSRCHCAPHTHTVFIGKLIAAAVKFPSERISANCVRRSVLIGNHDLHFPVLATEVLTPIFGLGAPVEAVCAPRWLWDGAVSPLLPLSVQRSVPPSLSGAAGVLLSARPLLCPIE